MESDFKAHYFKYFTNYPTENSTLFTHVMVYAVLKIHFNKGTHTEGGRERIQQLHSAI